MTIGTGSLNAESIGAESAIVPNCPICSGKRKYLFQAQLLKKHNVRYFLCESCGLIQTEKPFWLKEAYDRAIADNDTGLVSRNLELAAKLSALLYFCFNSNAPYLEAAGGYGLLTRLMRDRGFDFRWHDPYCENIFARGFEWDPANPSTGCVAVTAFEVLEHVWNPAEFITSTLAQAGTKTIIFSTLLYEGEPPLPEQWWYYSLDSGQHISFFRKETLKRLADKLGLRLYSHGSFHVFTETAIHETAFTICTSRLSVIADRFVQRRLRSRTFDDHSRTSEQQARR